MQVKIYNVDEILKELNTCIKFKKPFSLIRMGDGGIKFLHAILNYDLNMLQSIIEKEGIPFDKVSIIFQLWGKYFNEANFIDCPEVYFSNKFWPRFKRPEVIPIIKNWKSLYYNAEIYNTRYCNPEFNFLSLIKREKKLNLVDLLYGKKVCCITNVEKAVERLSKISSVSFVRIVGFWEDFYKNCFKKTIKIIKKNAKKFDLWLIGAGEGGRVFAPLVKQYGGRALDIGSVFDCWASNVIPKRLRGYVYKASKSSLYFRLNKSAMMYEKYI